MKKTKPSDFIGFPWSSVLKKSEAEAIASNIRYILQRTGDTFRELTYEEYKTERLKDGNYTDYEKDWFDLVIPYFKSAYTAQLFSKNW